MIYKDIFAHRDMLNIPMRRLDDTCINCRKYHFEHDGWRCPSAHAAGKQFSNLCPEDSYMTISMLESLGYVVNMRLTHPISDHLGKLDLLFGAFRIQLNDKKISATEPKVVKAGEPVKEVDLTDWRSWAHNKPNDCPCGIKKIDCEFHR